MPIAAMLDAGGQASTRIERARDHAQALDQIRGPEPSVEHHAPELVGKLVGPGHRAVHDGHPPLLLA
eukprot:7321919-Pyramimonas_sp.AAC.1